MASSHRSLGGSSESKKQGKKRKDPTPSPVASKSKKRTKKVDEIGGIPITLDRKKLKKIINDAKQRAWIIAEKMTDEEKVSLGEFSGIIVSSQFSRVACYPLFASINVV